MISIFKHITIRINHRAHVSVYSNWYYQLILWFHSYFLALQFQPPRYSPQLSYPTYPTYPSRSTPPIVHNPANSRRLPPLTTSPTPPIERWQQPSYAQPFTGNSILSPTASYPPAYVTYSTNSANAYSYHIPAMYEEVPWFDPRSSSPYSRNSGTSHVSHTPPRAYTPPPIKRKRKRADAAQLEVLNKTYNRTAFPSTEERIALAKMLDMSARSVQIWWPFLISDIDDSYLWCQTRFQNKRQSMRQTNRQSSGLAGTVEPMITGTRPQRRTSL